MKNEPAFPTYHGGNSKCSTDGCGMTLRDYFAAKAMQSLTDHTGIYVDQSWFEEICEASYRVADAMIKVRETK